MKPLLVIFLLNIICNSNLNFKSLGLDDYNLGVSFEKVIRQNPELIKIGSSKIHDELIVYSISKTQMVLGKELNVNYLLAFEEGLLRAYTFSVSIDEDYNFYKLFVEKARKNNNFVKRKNNISFIEKTENCEKFLRLKFYSKKLFIYGGISDIGSYW